MDFFHVFFSGSGWILFLNLVPDVFFLNILCPMWSGVPWQDH